MWWWTWVTWLTICGGGGGGGGGIQQYVGQVGAHIGGAHEYPQGEASLLTEIKTVCLRTAEFIDQCLELIKFGQPERGAHDNVNIIRSN